MFAFRADCFCDPNQCNWATEMRWFEEEAGVSGFGVFQSACLPSVLKRCKTQKLELRRSSQLPSFLPSAADYVLEGTMTSRIL